MIRGNDWNLEFDKILSLLLLLLLNVLLGSHDHRGLWRGRLDDAALAMGVLMRRLIRSELQVLVLQHRRLALLDHIDRNHFVVLLLESILSRCSGLHHRWIRWLHRMHIEDHWVEWRVHKVLIDDS